MAPEERTNPEHAEPEVGTRGAAHMDECAGIDDPIRRGLCRVCQAPVVGEAPFCREHEPPVP